MLFGLPPSPSHDAARAHAPTLEKVLATALPGLRVEVAASYGALGDDLLANRLSLAWAPPIVCARVEMAGGRVALRAVRGGVTAYRAGIVCRVGLEPDLALAPSLVAAWVHEDSAAGYLLARSWLKQRKIDAVHGFKRALFLGSYVAALQAVADGRADIASVYASLDGAPQHSTLDEIDDVLRAKLQIFATTGETQTDGVVVAPHTNEDDGARVVAAILEVARSDEGARVMRKLLSCDELRPAPARSTSTALRDLVTQERAR